MKQLISRRSFLKAAGVTTTVAAVSLGAPAASACYPGSFKDITILYTNDVHTYIDKKIAGTDLCCHRSFEKRAIRMQAKMSCW